MNQSAALKIAETNSFFSSWYPRRYWTEDGRWSCRTYASFTLRTIALLLISSLALWLPALCWRRSSATSTGWASIGTTAKTTVAVVGTVLPVAQVWSVHCIFSTFLSGQVTNSILFCWLFKIKDRCTKVRFQQMHRQGLHQLLLSVSWDLHN